MRALPFTLLVVMIAGLGAAIHWRSVPSLRARDDLGPVPRFRWIASGERRPIPSIAPVTVGSVLALTRPREAGAAPRPASCFKQLDPQDCLERNWRDLLARFGAAPLTAGPGERAYRFLDLPSQGPVWRLTTLRVAPDGAAQLEVVTRSSDLLRSDYARRVQAVPREAAAAFERSLRWSSYSLVAADPRALVMQRSCHDGVNAVLEAQVAGRYRYVSRYSCHADDRRLAGWGARLAGLTG